MRLSHSHYHRNRCPLSMSMSMSSTIALALAVLVATSRTLAFSSSQASSKVSRRVAVVSARRANSQGSDVDGIEIENDDNEGGGYTFRDSWSLITLGDLHMEDDMSYHEQARRDCLEALEDFPLMGAPTKTKDAAEAEAAMELNNDLVKSMCEKPGGELTEEELRILLARKTNKYMRSHIVSLGDLGRKDIRHEQGDAGTTKSFVDAKTYFDGFGGIPYDLVTVR